MRGEGERVVRRALLGFLILLLPLAAFAASRPPVRGSGGAVASDERLATAAGLEILQAGGNAVDGAVATALALAVVEPEAGNLGGGGFATVRMGGEIAHLDFRETAPAAATRDLYLDDQGEPIPEASLVGPLAAGVPGSPTGLYALHERFGRLPWAKVVAPSIRLAREGFVVSTRLSRGVNAKQRVLAKFPETAGVWLPEGKAPVPGSRIRLPELAETLTRYAKEGPRAITNGPVAAAIVATSTKHGGILSLEDLASYRPVWREPLLFEAFGWQVASPPLPSSGGMLIGATAKILEDLDWAAEPRFGASRAHLLAEAWRRTYADRFLMGDPSSTKADRHQLMDAAWLASRAASIDRAKASDSQAVQPWSGEPPAEGKDTTHLSVVDAEGGIVSLTTTLNGLFGCGLRVPVAGFFLNNEMDDFATAVGRPNLYGLVQGEANAVAPGRRMLSSQSPTIAWREGESVAIGGRGGSQIPSATLQALLSFWVDGDDLQEALDRPRIHHQWLPDQIVVEADALSPETRAELRKLGHEVVDTGSIAQVHAVRWLADGTVEAAAEPRGSGGSAGVVRPIP